MVSPAYRRCSENIIGGRMLNKQVFPFEISFLFKIEGYIIVYGSLRKALFYSLPDNMIMGTLCHREREK